MCLYSWSWSWLYNTITLLTEFFHADAEINIHPLPVSWYFISSLLWWYLCSCMHTMSMLWSTADAVSSSSWPILFEVLMLNVTICIMLLHFSSFCLCLSFVADLLNAGARAPTSAECVPFLPAQRVMQFGQMV